MAGKTIKVAVAGGKKFSAYLAVPPSGKGPGILMLQEIFGVNASMRAIADYFAEEGYVVLVPDLFWRMKPGVELGYDEASFKKAFEYYGKFDVDQGVKDMGAALKALKGLKQCTGKVAALGFCLGGKLAYLAAAKLKVDAAVGFYGVGIEKDLKLAKNIKCPMVLHFGGADKHVPQSAVAQVQKAFKKRDDVEIYVYPDADHAFYGKDRASYNKPAAMMAHTRTIALLRRVMGPHYDLSKLWDLHCLYEFGTRNVDDTMATMVAQPYVNHVPTMTGGVGYKELHRFYTNHFVNANPADTKLIPISRTIGADRVVDEMLFCFTHDREIDWMLPGIAPTGKYVEVPLLAVINFRGDKLYHEHIYWDQASVLVQIGLLDPKNLPVAGRDTAKKLLDETRPSNTLMRRWAESAPKAAE
jgi:carboxymethylenebutenolidase